MTSEELSTRDPRVMLSKSFLTSADLCGQRVWLDLYDPKPFPVVEKIVFGKAVDAAVQQAVLMQNAGISPLADLELTLAPAVAAVESERERAFEKGLDDSGARAVDFGEVRLAIQTFVRDALSMFDWQYAALQHHIRVPLGDAGLVDCHPDVITRDNAIVDIKTASRAKPASAAAESYLELGLYAIAREAERGEPVPWVAYLTYVRPKQQWQLVPAPVTQRMRDVALERAAGMKRALLADALLNSPDRLADGAVPENSTFINGPKFSGLCTDCAHRPGVGKCRIAEGVE